MPNRTPPAPAVLAPAPAEAAQLITYLARLPLCRTSGEILETTLAQAMQISGAYAGLAATPEELIAGGGGDAPWTPTVRAAVEQLLPAPNPEGDVELAPAPAKSIWTATLLDSTEQPLPILYAALPAEGLLQGVLALVLPAAELPTPAVTEALTLVTSAAGGLLATRRNLALTHQRLHELGLLYEVGRVVGSTLDLHTLLKAIMRITQITLRSEACTLMLLDERRQELVFEIPLGEKEDELTQFRLPLEQGLAGWVARMGHPAIANDLRNDPRFDAAVDASSGFQTRAALCVPLQVRGTVIGVLEVLNKQDHTPYTPHDLALLTTLAGQAAVAIDNARLYRSLQEEHERLLSAEEEVRRTLARDLHDGPAQDLVAISMGVEITRRLLDRDPSRCRQELDNLDALSRRVTRQIRTLLFELRPIALETRGLRAAIESYIQQLNQNSPTQYTFMAEGCKDRLNGEVEQAAFSIVQEALGNIRKHAQATTVQIQMLETDNAWIIQVTDNGLGFDLDTVLRSYENRGSLGLLNMRERAVAVGGQLNLQSAPGQGTTITLRVPMPKESAE